MASGFSQPAFSPWNLILIYLKKGFGVVGLL
jgi:hypothetical protein